jgi:hypothetical protein
VLGSGIAETVKGTHAIGQNQAGRDRRTQAECAARKRTFDGFGGYPQSIGIIEPPVYVVFALIVNLLTVFTLLKVIAALAVSHTTSLNAVSRVSTLQLVAVVHWPEAPPSPVCAHALAPANYTLIPIRVQVELKNIA